MQLKAADRIIVSQDRINSGIDELVFGIDRVSDGLENLASAFEWGFSELIWQLEQQTERMKEILNVLQKPLDTQAKELKKRAEYAYKNGWINDALEDFLESEKKNRYDYTIYQYLGNIYLFHEKKPENALEYYEKALKYASPRSHYHASYALLHIGLVRYLHGDFQEAYEAVSQAIELSPDFYEAYYQRAQYCACLDRYDEAIEDLRSAINGDRYYCVKADSEKDFDVMKEQLRAFFKEWMTLAFNQAETEIIKAEEIIQDAESILELIVPTIHKPRDATYKFGVVRKAAKVAKNRLNDANNFLERRSLLDCWDAIDNAHNSQDVAYLTREMALYSSNDYLWNQISEIADKKRKSVKKTTLLITANSQGPAFFGTLLTTGLFIPYYFYKVYNSNLGFFRVFGLVALSVITIPLFWLISYFIIETIFSSSIFSPNYRRKGKAQLAKLQLEENTLKHVQAKIQTKWNKVGREREVDEIAGNVEALRGIENEIEFERTVSIIRLQKAKRRKSK